MAAFLLWNVHRKPLDGLVQNLVRQLRIDVVLLVEYAFGMSQLTDLLTQEGLLKRVSPQRFGVFVRENHRFARLKYRVGTRVCLWSWTPRPGNEGLIVLVHGLDRRNYDDNTRRVFFRQISEVVRRCEKARNHQSTIIVGDFNAHPFESAIADSDGLHAIGVPSVRERRDRPVRGTGTRADFFYNPMWRTYGHQQHPAAGAATHYWIGSGALELGWYMVDQVVLRPGESIRFPENQLRIITRVGELPLLDEHGVPDAATASDHLPVVFHWNL